MDDLKKLIKSAKKDFENCKTLTELDNAKSQYIGKSGFITEAMRGLSKLSNEENYFIDFIGCTLFDQNKKEVGLVKDIIPIKKNDILIFDSPEGEKMISFAKDLILFFDKEKKKLIMDIFEGTI